MAGSVNKVILVGNLGRDPEIRRTQDGRPIANISVATTDTWKDKTAYDAQAKKLAGMFRDNFKKFEKHVGDDVLSAGVAVMARPPGKRNSNISQLSGGEKALTAVALVFSIFELNPAPFCLLDEVDAPLDDNNVGRFCDIVRDMSERVQFVFITHNKSTMELANHLIGVTMGEPGVSRLVAVDVDEAVRMAAVG